MPMTNAWQNPYSYQRSLGIGGGRQQQQPRYQRPMPQQGPQYYPGGQYARAGEPNLSQGWYGGEAVPQVQRGGGIGRIQRAQPAAYTPYMQETQNLQNLFPGYSNMPQQIQQRYRSLSPMIQKQQMYQNLSGLFGEQGAGSLMQQEYGYNPPQAMQQYGQGYPQQRQMAYNPYQQQWPRMGQFGGQNPYGQYQQPWSPYYQGQGYPQQGQWGGY